jgi:DNA polymerase I
MCGDVVQVWHNYSFDKHILQRHGLGISPDILQKHGQDPSQLNLKLAGFAADTMHMARLHDAVRRATKSYSLASLTSDKTIMSSPGRSVIARSKVSMKDIFSVPKMTKTGKLSASLKELPAIHEIQVSTCMHTACGFESLSAARCRTAHDLGSNGSAVKCLVRAGGE